MTKEMHLNSLLPRIHNSTNASLTVQSSDNCKQAHLEMVQQQLKRKRTTAELLQQGDQNPKLWALRRLLKVGRSSVVFPRLSLCIMGFVFGLLARRKLFQTPY